MRKRRWTSNKGDKPDRQRKVNSILQPLMSKIGELGLTVNQAEEKMKISKGSISKYISGECTPNWHTLSKLEDFIDGKTKAEEE